MSSLKKVTNVNEGSTAKSAVRTIAEVILGAPRGGKTNYLKWLEFLIDTLGPLFGNMASVLKTHTAYVVPRVTQADYLGDEDAGGAEDENAEDGDANEIDLTPANRRELKLRAIAARNAEVRELAKEKPKFYNAIWATMSAESRQLVQAHVDFPNTFAREDPNELLRIVRLTHFTNINGVGGAAQAVEDLVLKQREFAALSQKPGESIAVFKRNFDDMVNTLTNMGVPAMNQPELAMNFLLKLDSTRHASMLVELKNQASRGIPYPDNLDSAYRLASNWHATSLPHARGGSGGGDDMYSVFVLSDNIKPTAKSDAKGKSLDKPGSKFKHNGKKGGDKSDPSSNNANNSRAASSVSGSTGGVGGGRKCFLCKSKDHLIGDCPYNGLKDRATNLLTLSSAIGEDDEEDEENEHTVNLMVTNGEPYSKTVLLIFADNEVVFDCAAGKSLFKSPNLLRNLRKAQRVSKIGGVEEDSIGIHVTEEGEFQDLGTVGLSEKSVANILSQAEVVDKGYDVSYDCHADAYAVKGAESMWIFTRKELDDGSKSPFYTTRVLVNTVADNMRRYTNREVSGAQKAVELQRRLGYPSSNAAIQMINKGILNCDVSAADVRNATAIFGHSIAELKGKTKKRASVIATPVLAPRVTQIQQTMQVDLMFIKEIPFLVGVLSPLGLVMCAHVKDRTTKSLGKEMKSFVSNAQGYHFDVQELRVDGEGALGALVNDLRADGVVIHRAGPGEHVPVVERMIQTIKARVRAHENTLPYVMPKQLIIGCVLAMVRNINIQPNVQSTDGVSPREQFTGIKLNAKRDIRCGFGDYVQARVPVTDNTMKPRTEGCITMYPSGNTTGSVIMLKLSTLHTVTRDQFEILPIPTEVSTYLTSLATKQGYYRGREEPMHVPPPQGAEFLTADDNTIPANPLAPTMMPIDGRLIVPELTSPNVTTASIHDDRALMPPTQSADSIVHEAGVIDLTGDSDHTDIDFHRPFALRRSARIARQRTVVSGNEFSELSHSSAIININVVLTDNQTIATELRKQIVRRSDWHDSYYAFTMSVRAAMKHRGKEAEAVILAELQQMLDKGVWHGVRTKDLTKQERKAIIRSSMFLKDKYFASGAFEKFKARLVAGGDQQDKTLYENLSSPTAATSSVLCIAAIAAAERRCVKTIDIGGAFLNASITTTGVKVHMRLDKVMSDMLMQLDASYKQFLRLDDTIVVELDKALYGCVEAASLWYMELSGKLREYEFKENPYDCCVFNKHTICGNYRVQITVTLHVDDLLVTCTDEQEILNFKKYLDGIYPETKMHSGKVLDYIGMTFNFEVDGEVKVTMKNCVDDILNDCGIETIKPKRTPAASTLFDIRMNAPKVTSEEAKYFHTFVAKLLYLAKRVRPECLTAVAFLATRVNECDVDDMAKLRRLLGYVLATRDRGIKLRIGEHMSVKAYIDAAYGVHSNSGRSHTGCIIVLGEGGPVFAKSSKQKIVTKSSTEAELVAVSDYASQAIHLRNFISSQGYETGPAIIYQDNLSCIALMKRGGPGSQRSRHINIRHFWVKERVENGEVIFEYLKSEDMHVNALSKPVQGAQFIRERDGLTNWELTINDNNDSNNNRK